MPTLKESESRELQALREFSDEVRALARENFCDPEHINSELDRMLAEFDKKKFEIER